MKKIWIAVSLYIIAHLSLVVITLPGQSVFAAANALISLNSMAFSLILAARFSWVDYIVGGPDKAYVLHRWLGYIAVASLSLHWVSAASAGVAIVPLLSDIGEESGEFAAILILLLVAISILKIIPYHLWKKSHLLMGPLFIIAAFHSFFSSSPFIAYSFTWFIMLFLTTMAILAWFKTLFNQRRKPIIAKVISINKIGNAIDFELKVANTINLKAGQFASISVNKEGLQEQHPFTIAGCSNDNEIRFIIANTGDYTQRLNHQLSLGDEVCIHSVSGKFRPQHNIKRNAQVWIAAGTGVTPFLAALNNMQPDEGEKIDLIYACGKNLDSSIYNQLLDYQKELTQFSLHILAPNERLSTAHFKQLALKQLKTDLYLCGPNCLKQSAQQLWEEHLKQQLPMHNRSALRSIMKVNKLKGAIYSEDFDFRAATEISIVSKLLSVITQLRLKFFSNEVNKNPLDKPVLLEVLRLVKRGISSYF